MENFPMRITYLIALATTVFSLNAQALMCVGQSLPGSIESQREVSNRYLQMSQISPEVFSTQDVYTKVRRCFSRDFEGYVVEQQYVQNGQVKYSHFIVNLDQNNRFQSVSELQLKKF